MCHISEGDVLQRRKQSFYFHISKQRKNPFNFTSLLNVWTIKDVFLVYVVLLRDHVLGGGKVSLCLKFFVMVFSRFNSFLTKFFLPIKLVSNFFLTTDLLNISR